MRHGNPANANGGARRRVRATVLAEETHCALCGKPVDKTLTIDWGKHGPKCQDPGCPGCVPHPMRPEVDEIIPRYMGGSPIDRRNCRLTHRTCNRQRYSSRPKVQRNNLGTSRNWRVGATPTPGGTTGHPSD